MTKQSRYYSNRLYLYLPEDYSTSIRVQALIEKKTISQFVIEHLDKAGFKRSALIEENPSRR